MYSFTNPVHREMFTVSNLKHPGWMSEYVLCKSNANIICCTKVLHESKVKREILTALKSHDLFIKLDTFFAVCNLVEANIKLPDVL